MAEKQWQITEESVKNLELCDVKFAFEQAEKQLNGTVEESSVLITRTIVLLTLMLGFVTSIIGYVIDKIEKNNLNSIPLISTLLLTLIYLFIQIFKIKDNIKGHRYATAGSEPIDLLSDWYPYTYPNKEKREIAVMLAEIRSYQKRIESNKKTNERRWVIFNHSLKMIALLPIFIASSYFLIRLLLSMLFVCYPDLSQAFASYHL